MNSAKPIPSSLREMVESLFILQLSLSLICIMCKNHAIRKNYKRVSCPFQYAFQHIMQFLHLIIKKYIMQLCRKNKKPKQMLWLFPLWGRNIVYRGFSAAKTCKCSLLHKKENSNEIILQQECQGHTAAAVRFREVLPCGQSALLS